MLPWLAHGHISPFLELAKRLITRNFHIYICSTPIILNSIDKKKNKVLSSDKKYYHEDDSIDSIQLVELQLPSSPDLPSHYHTTNGLPARLMIPLENAYEMSAPRFAEIVNNLKPDLVIYDFNQPWAAEIASSQNIPAVQFVTAGTTLLALGLHQLKTPRGTEFPFPEMRLRDYELEMVRGQRDDDDDVLVSDDKDRTRFLQALERSHKILLIKSCEEIEGKYFGYVSSLIGKKIVPVGTLVQDPGVLFPIS